MQKRPELRGRNPIFSNHSMNSLRSNSISCFVAQIAFAIRDSVTIQKNRISLKTSSCGMFLMLAAHWLFASQYCVVRPLIQKHSARRGIYRMYYYRNLLRFLCRVSETSKSTWEAVWAKRVLRMITIIGQPASELRTFLHSFFCFGFLSGDRKKMKAW